MTSDARPADTPVSEPTIPEALSPDDIEKASFHTVKDGYDKDEVEVFLHAVATDVRALKGEVESARLGSHRPYDALGREMGALMQHAHDAAAHVRKTAENEATTILQKAQHDAAKARQEAEQLKKKYETEKLIARDEALAAVDRLREQAEQQRQMAEAEGNILHQEARRSAKRLQDDAKKKAGEIIATATSESHARAAEAERRLRRLQEFETKLRRRIEFLTAKLQALTQQVKQALETKGEEERPDFPTDSPSRTPSIRITDTGTIRLDPEKDEAVDYSSSKRQS